MATVGSDPAYPLLDATLDLTTGGITPTHRGMTKLEAFTKANVAAILGNPYLVELLGLDCKGLDMSPKIAAMGIGVAKATIAALNAQEGE